MSELTIKECREKRGSIYKEMQEIIKAAGKEGRGMSPEESAKFDKLDSEQDGLKRSIDAREKADRLKDEMETRDESRERHDYHAAKRDLPTSTDYRQAFVGWGMGRELRSDVHVNAAKKCGVNIDKAAWPLRMARSVPRNQADIDSQYLTRATTVVQNTTDTTLGSNAIQNEPMKAIESALLAYGGVREVSRVIRTKTGATLQIPTNNDTGNKATIITQAGTVDVSGVEYGQTTMGAYKYSSGMVKASIEFMQDLSYNFPGWIGGVLGERVARGLNTDFTVGVSSSGEPDGVATGSIATHTASTALQVTMDNLMVLEHSLDPAYRRMPGTRFMFHDSVLRDMKRLTIQTSDARPLWQPGLVAGAPDTILGYQYTVNQDMATATTASNVTVKKMLFGDFSHYIVRDVMDIELRRLDERYAEQALVAFFTLSRHDGVLVVPSTAAPPMVCLQQTT